MTRTDNIDEVRFDSRRRCLDFVYCFPDIVVTFTFHYTAAIIIVGAQQMAAAQHAVAPVNEKSLKLYCIGILLRFCASELSLCTVSEVMTRRMFNELAGQFKPLYDIN